MGTSVTRFCAVYSENVPLPNVLVIGAQKCGTTALQEFFVRHPQCAGGKGKETNFFVDESPWPIGRWKLGVDWYRAQFEDAEIRADVTPSYTFWPLLPGVVERAHALVPDAKIVYLVRDPIDRMMSHYRHWVWMGWEDKTFEAAVLDSSDQNMFVMGSRYATQLRRWTDVYPAERFLVMHQREVRTGAPRLWPFLGVEPLLDFELEANSSENFTVPTRVAGALPRRVAKRLPSRVRERVIPKPKISDALRAQLQSMLAGEMAEFEAATGVRPAEGIAIRP
jgi:hypothetical protein